MSENRDQEEQAARLLWEQIERIRSRAAPQPPPDAPGAANEEGAALTRIASDLAEWMAERDAGTRRDLVRQKMWSRIAEIAPAPESAARRSAPEVHARGWGSPLRPWQWAVAAAALVAILLAPRLIRPQAPEHPSAPHATVVREVRQLVANTMTPEETRAAWLHMLKCPGCFEKYKVAWEQQHGRPSGACAPRPGTWRVVAARGR